MMIGRKPFGDRIGRWLSVCVVAILSGLLLCQVMVSERESQRRQQQIRERSHRGGDEDCTGGQSEDHRAVETSPPEVVGA
jgi:hypothetical protein